VRNNRLVLELYEFEDEIAMRTKPAPHVKYGVVLIEIKANNALSTMWIHYKNPNIPKS
jgi:hypothetical protein